MTAPRPRGSSKVVKQGRMRVALLLWNPCAQSSGVSAGLPRTRHSGKNTESLSRLLSGAGAVGWRGPFLTINPSVRVLMHETPGRAVGWKLPSLPYHLHLCSKEDMPVRTLRLTGALVSSSGSGRAAALGSVLYSLVTSHCTVPSCPRASPPSQPWLDIRLSSHSQPTRLMPTGKWVTSKERPMSHSCAF